MGERYDKKKIFSIRSEKRPQKLVPVVTDGGNNSAVVHSPLSPYRPDFQLGHDSTTIMERLSANLIEGARFTGERHRDLRLVEYAFGVTAAAGTFFAFFNPQMGLLFESAIKFIDLIAAGLLIFDLAYFSSLGERRPEVFLIFADILNSHVTDLRITLTQDYDATTRAVLKAQLASALHDLDHISRQFPFAVDLLDANGPRERNRILWRLLKPDGRRYP